MVQTFLIIPRYHSIITVQNMLSEYRRSGTFADKIVIIGGKFRDAIAAEIILEAGFFLDGHDLAARICLAAKMTCNPFGFIHFRIALPPEKILISPPDKIQRANKQNYGKNDIHKGQTKWGGIGLPLGIFTYFLAQAGPAPLSAAPSIRL